MLNSIKGFLQVKKYTTYKFTRVYASTDTINNLY